MIAQARDVRHCGTQLLPFFTSPGLTRFYLAFTAFYRLAPDNGVFRITAKEQE
jgi:hypothetical protein